MSTLATDQNYAKVQFIRSIWLSTGQGIEIDLADAAKCLRLAADQNYARAQVKYCLCLWKAGGVLWRQKLRDPNLDLKATIEGAALCDAILPYHKLAAASRYVTDVERCYPCIRHLNTHALLQNCFPSPPSMRHLIRTHKASRAYRVLIGIGYLEMEWERSRQTAAKVGFFEDMITHASSEKSKLWLNWIVRA
jgi:hypothetical protein